MRSVVAMCIVGIVVAVSPAWGMTMQGGGRGSGPGQIVALPEVPPQPVGTGAISGVVIDGRTGAPIEGAVVSLSGGGPVAIGQQGRPRQLTDSKGRFIFTDLPSFPSYSLSAGRQGFLSSGSVRLSALAEGQWNSEVRVKLWRPGSISGAVRDEQGEPLVGVPIRILVGATVAGRLRWAAGVVTETDDRGMYRFAGLERGRYLVHVPSIQVTLPSGEAALIRLASRGPTGATAMSGPLNVVRGPDGSGVVIGPFATPPPDATGSVYPAAFHPAARSAEQATAITLGLGDDRTGVDVQMAPVPSVSVSGAVAGPADLIAGIPVRILPAGNEMLGLSGDAGLTKADGVGRFTFSHIPAGDYVIVASRSVSRYFARGAGGREGLLPAGASPFWLELSTLAASNGMTLNENRLPGPDAIGRLTVSVGNRAVGGLVVPVTPAVSVSGYFEWDGSETPPPGVRATPVRLEPADADITLSTYMSFPTQPPAGAPATRISFTLENVKPGRYAIGEMLGGAPYRLVGSTWNGRDIIDTPLEVSGDGPVTGIVLKMSSQISKVSGAVRLADGRVAADGAVIAFPASPTALRESGTSAVRFRTASIAADGRYELPSLLPGDYFLAAVSVEDRTKLAEPAFLEALARQATRVSIASNTVLSQDLRVIGAPR